MGGSEMLRDLTLEEPGGGPPVRFGLAVNGLERSEAGSKLGLAKEVPKFFVAKGFAVDCTGAAADIAGSGFDAATMVDKGENFALFGFVEKARTAGGRHGRRR